MGKQADTQSPARHMARQADTKSHLDHLYAAMSRAEYKVGGGEGLVGIYGSMTQQGTHNIMSVMAQHTCLNSDSVLVDIGSGLCRPLLHAAVQCRVHRTFGVELDAVKCQKAVPFVQHTATLLEAAGVEISTAALPTIVCTSVEQLGSLDPATHAYAAWEGFPVEAKMAVGRLFAATPSLHTITIVQRSLRNEAPAEVMDDLGFGPVTLITPAIPVFMSGSGRRLNAYTFTKKAASPAAVDSRGRGRRCSTATTSAMDNPVHDQPPPPAGLPSCLTQHAQQDLPSLGSATPFSPAAIMDALAGMRTGIGGGTDLQASRHGQGQLMEPPPTGLGVPATAAGVQRSSSRLRGHAAGAQEGVTGHAQGDMGPQGEGCVPHHGRGLRRSRKRTARAMEQDTGMTEEEEEEEVEVKEQVAVGRGTHVCARAQRGIRGEGGGAACGLGAAGCGLEGAPQKAASSHFPMSRRPPAAVPMPAAQQVQEQQQQQQQQQQQHTPGVPVLHGRMASSRMAAKAAGRKQDAAVPLVPWVKELKPRTVQQEGRPRRRCTNANIH